MNADNSVIYQAPSRDLWVGRSTNSETPQYWHEVVELIDRQHISLRNDDVTIVGYACEVGVQRNQGRIGAKGGADNIRKRLGKIALHHNRTVSDLGNIVCNNDDMEACQEAYAQTISSIIKAGSLPIGLGGGHDIAYATGKGTLQALPSGTTSVGIINFDAHFDLRPVVSSPNSGTPFYQLLTEQTNNTCSINYLPIGIQQQSNTRELYDVAKKLGVTYLDCIDCQSQTVKDTVMKFIEQNDHIYVSIDMDGFAAAYAPGVSAPSPLGLTPNFVMQLLGYVMGTGKVIACDIAELNPLYDIDNQTASLAARLVDCMTISLR